MPDKLGTPTLTVKYSGVYDFDELYKRLQEWVRDDGYHFEERDYRTKRPSPAGGEHDIQWDGWKNITPYARYWFFITWKIWDMKEVEVIKDGRKKKLSKGRVRIMFRAELEVNWQGRKSALLDFYNRYIGKKRIEKAWWDELYCKMHKLQTQTKELLDMQTQTNSHYDAW